MNVTKLQAIRERKALSQRELAEKAHVSRASIARGETGMSLRPATVRKLAEALGVEPAELMGE